MYIRLKMSSPTAHIMQCNVQLHFQSGIFSSHSLYIAVTPDSVTALHAGSISCCSQCAI